MNKIKTGYLRAASASGECPPLDELWACACGELPRDSKEVLNQHLAGCSWCAEKIARMSDPEAARGGEPKVPDALNRRAKKLWRVSILGRLWQTPWVWMTIFLSALGASFLMPRFYKQFLVIALVSGIRWALSERAQRHSITVTRLSGAEPRRSGAGRDRAERDLSGVDPDRGPKPDSGRSS
jgi:anti-sigma factor RsiW